jgi:hypothetical protein
MLMVLRRVERFFAILVVTTALTLGGLAHAEPGRPRVFADWIVGCDNGGSCQSNALRPDDSDHGPRGWVVITRQAGPQAAATVAIRLRDGRDGTVEPRVDAVQAVAVDGQTLPLRPGHAQDRLQFEPEATQTLLNAMREGNELTFLDAQRGLVARTSLKGLKAALLYIDEQQGRTGSRMKQAAALPIIRTPAASSAAASQLTDAQLEGFRTRFRCRAVEPIMLRQPIRYARLDVNHTLALVPAPCATGAYNSRVLAVVIKNDGDARAADLEFPMDIKSRHEVVSPHWKDADRQLQSYVKSRGLGDCGSIQTWVWDGSRFRLVLQSEMSECRGSVDFIPMWRADVRVR